MARGNWEEGASRLANFGFCSYQLIFLRFSLFFGIVVVPFSLKKKNHNCVDTKITIKMKCPLLKPGIKKILNLPVEILWATSSFWTKIIR